MLTIKPFGMAMLLVVFVPGTVLADMVILKSGEMFQTSRAWEENGVIHYYNEGRIVRVPQQDVERLIHSRAPAEKTMPPRSPSAARSPSSAGQQTVVQSPDDPLPADEDTGYMGLKWGQPPAQIGGLAFVETDPAYGGVRQYVRPRSKKRFGRARVDNIYYGFWQDKLYTILIEVSNYLDFMDLKAEAFRRYGAMDPQVDKPETFRWQAPGSDRLLAYDNKTDTGYLWMRSQMLHATVKARYPE